MNTTDPRLDHCVDSAVPSTDDTVESARRIARARNDREERLRLAERKARERTPHELHTSIGN
ncbi:MAG: hypothetical protein JNJ44_03760 [Zoogloeaceae bacterium]|nr:hypothetical protein [Zoogloeaceae bacterium]